MTPRRYDLRTDHSNAMTGILWHYWVTVNNLRQETIRVQLASEIRELLGLC